MKLILTKKFEQILLSTDTINLLTQKGINDIDEYSVLLKDSINVSNPKLNVENVFYEDITIDTYTGYIFDDNDKITCYLFIIPPKLGTRSGFITQQMFGFLSNVILKNTTSNDNTISNKPVYIINSDVSGINISKAINIVGSQILNFTFLDVFNRDFENILFEKKGKIKFKSLVDYNNLIGAINDYFVVDVPNKTIKFKSDKLKDFSQSLTNEPYYFAIKAYPALYLASKEKFDIDISLFENWYNDLNKITNKNIEAFYLFAKKIIMSTETTIQKIYYGAPGTGKSFEIDELTKDFDSEFTFRVTFHPEYSYSDFIGQLLPKVENKDGVKNISYEFNKGVFTQSLEKAYEDTSKDVYLILEEMSRGDVASIFGDIFQLLDREQNGALKGYSKYFINNDVISQDIIALPSSKVKLPPNLHILGTVNTSDQNVFVMDTAFKRRFDWEYISTNPVKDENNEYLNNPIIKLKKSDNTQNDYDWVDFYVGLNRFISDKEYLELGEDKQIGQFFIEFGSSSEEQIKKKIQNKLLQYLWSDVQKASYKNDKSIFSSNITSFSTLHSLFGKDEPVFSEDFFDCIAK